MGAGLNLFEVTSLGQVSRQLQQSIRRRGIALTLRYSLWKSSRLPWPRTAKMASVMPLPVSGAVVVFWDVSSSPPARMRPDIATLLDVRKLTHVRTVYQGLIPWAWIEASTKGAVLLFVASEAEYYARSFGASNFVGGITGGMVGGLAQAYATMGFCTCMKTVEITKHKVAAAGMKPPGTMETFMDIYRREGIRGINRGVNAVAVRQVTNWGSRFGLSRVAETGIRRFTNKEHGEKLSAVEKITASALGGGLSAWNQPIEVVRVEMQSKTEDPNRPKNMNVGKAFRYIYSQNGLKGLYRGVTPRIGLGVWQTVCMVALGDMAKEAVEKLTGETVTAKH